MKKFAMLLVVLMLALNSGCSKEPQEMILGYWVSARGETLSFDERGKIVVNDTYIGDYSVYEDRITINVNTPLLDDLYDANMTARVEITKDVLIMYDMNDGSVLRYYRDGAIKSFINEEYNVGYKKSTIKEQGAVVISYADEWDLHLEGTELDGITSEQELEAKAKKAEKLFNKEVFNLYKKMASETGEEYSFFCYRATYSWEEIYYEISVTSNEKIINQYAVNPDTGRIFFINEKGGLYSLWNGVVSNVSDDSGTLLKPIVF